MSYGSYWNSSSWSPYSYSRYSYPSSNLYRNRSLYSSNSRSSWNTGEYSYGPSRYRRYPWERDESRERERRRRRRRERRRERRYIRRNRRINEEEDSASPERDADDSRDSSPEPEPKPEPKPEPPKEVFAEALQITGIDLHVEKNTIKHKTDKYDRTKRRPDPKDDKKTIPGELVVRRGDTLLLTAKLDRKFDRAKNDMRIVFSNGKTPLEIRSTLADLKVDESNDANVFSSTKWAAQLAGEDNESVTVKVGIPANCIVGEWNLKVKTSSLGKDKEGNENPVFTYEHNEDVAILFNPWCPDDDVYMEKTELLNEYVLNDTGCIYRGSSSRIGAKPWNYGQFEETSFEAALYLLRQGCARMPAVSMSDAMKVSRVMAQMVNSSDDNGVLEGNWSGNYGNEVSPTKWVGSVKILEKYMDKRRPVKYGQCWVFSGVTTTVCRALGLPTFSVTNFSSAHDTECSNTIDKFYDMDGELDKYLTNDSIWNFHVWNEVWMKRRDLKDERMNGWQVIDATPQEQSENLYTCGPCPVWAVKNGICDVKYDAGFVFSEVNADEVHWTMLSSSRMRVTSKNTNKVGQFISTKKPTTTEDDSDDDDPFERSDVTDQYKHPEGSDAEREAVKKAYDTAVTPRAHVYDKRDDLRPVYLDIDVDDVLIGSDLGIRVKVKNPGKFDRKVEKLQVKISAESYTGWTDPDPFYRTEFKDVPVASKKDNTVSLTVGYDDYFKYLKEMFMIKIEARAIVEPLSHAKPDLPVSEEEDTRFRRPDIDVKNPRRGEVNVPVKFKLTFKNPLPIPLTDCEISIESSHGFYNKKDIKIPDVPANGIFTEEVELKPKKTGRQSASFSFESKELKDVSGRGLLRIKKAAPPNDNVG